MLLAGNRKGTDALFDQAFASWLRLGRSRFAVWDVFVCSSQQPHRPQRATDTNQQHRYPFLLNNPPTLPIEQRALQALPAAFVPPATGVGHKSFLGGRQTRDYK